jgi:succinoglycan biosynthesis protein ExoM
MTMPVAHVCVCVCTFRRPALVAALLHALAAQETHGAFTMSVVVADNDRLESARSAVEAAARALPSLSIEYVVEADQNIAKARNKAVSRSTGDFIAFIDDDELPPEDWLSTALRTCIQFESDGVLAPVRPRFEHRPPAWLVKGRFCERPEHPTGHRLQWRETRTGNTLFRRSLVAHTAEPFATAFGNGGEDQAFFKRLIENGAVFVWCNEAPVYEVVPPERCRRRYLLRRALLRGQNERSLTDLRGIGKSVVAVPVYLLAMPMALIAGQDRFMQVCVRLCDHFGKLAALLGFRPLGAKYLSGS